MGKRKTSTTIKGSESISKNNVVIHNYPPAAPPINQISVFDILQSKDAEIRKLESMLEIMHGHIKAQAEEMDRLRSHITRKDNYINDLIIRKAS